MRRSGALLAALSGIALIVAAFLDIVTKSGGNIVTEGGNVPVSLGGVNSWLGWSLLVAGVLVLSMGLILIRVRSRIVALVLLVVGGVAAAVGIWALVDPLGFYVQVGALQVGEDADAISSIVKQFGDRVSAEIGAWVAAIAGGIAALVGIVHMVTPDRRRTEEASGAVGSPRTPAAEQRQSPVPTAPPGGAGEVMKPEETGATAAEPEPPAVTTDDLLETGETDSANPGSSLADPPSTSEPQSSPPNADDWR